MTSRPIPILVALVAVTTALLTLSTQAHASSAFVDGNGTLNYIADAGEANDVTVGPSNVGGGVTAIALSDPGATVIRTGNGCTPVSATFIACQIHDPLVWLNVSLADLDDRFVDTAGLGDCDTPSFVSGGAGDDRLTGGQGLDNLRGDDGADILSGGPTGDNLEGGPGGADFMDGGSGADLLNGGSGTDYADYSSRTTPMLVSLNGTLGLGPEVEEKDNPRISLLRCLTDGDIGEDVVLPNVENVWGGSATDVLIGNDSRNGLFGHGGGDILDGAGGPDVLDGGAGTSDSVEYTSRTAGVTVTADGAANDGEPGEGDRVVDVEEVYGGSGNDWLVGSPSTEDKLFGGEGDDRLDGGEDACGYSEGFVACLAPMRDRLYGGPHATGDTVDYSSRDVPLSITLESVANGAAGEYDWIFGVENVTGGASDDYIAGTGSANRLTGGGGADGIYGWGGADYVDSRDWRTDYVYCDAGVDEVFGDDIDVLPTGDCETTTLLSSVIYGGRYRGP